MFADFRILLTGSATFTKWKKLFTDIVLPANTSVTYSVRAASDLNCSLYTGQGILDHVAPASSQVSLGALSGSANTNMCVTAHLKTTNRSATPFLTGLIATYVEAPLTFSYDAVVTNQSGNLNNQISMYGTNATFVSSSYAWNIFPIPAPTFAGG